MMKKMAVWTDISPDYFHFLLSILYHQGALPTFICKLFVLEGQTDEIWGGGRALSKCSAILAAWEYYTEEVLRFCSG